MLTTTELGVKKNEAWSLLQAGNGKAYIAEIAQAEKEWKEYLFQEFADDFSTQAAGLVFVLAQEQAGDNNSYGSIEGRFRELIQLIREVKEIDFV